MQDNEHTEPAAPEKSLFRIGEVSRLTSTKPFVLRFWETEFPMLQPVKSPKGHRLYRREDIETVFVIKRLLYDEGFTIAGARRHLRDQAEAGQSNGSNGDHAAEATGDGIFSLDNSGESAAHTNRPPEAQRSLGLNRQTLLDLRDSLRSLLTLLESE